MKGGQKTIIEPHERFKGVYILRGKDEALVTRNIAPGESVYNEKRVSVEVPLEMFNRLIGKGRRRKD